MHLNKPQAHWYTPAAGEIQKHTQRYREGGREAHYNSVKDRHISRRCLVWDSVLLMQWRWETLMMVVCRDKSFHWHLSIWSGFFLSRVRKSKPDDIGGLIGLHLILNTILVQNWWGVISTVIICSALCILNKLKLCFSAKRSCQSGNDCMNQFLSVNL